MATNPQYPDQRSPEQQGFEQRPKISNKVEEIPPIEIVKKSGFPWPLIALIVAGVILATIVYYMPRAPHVTRGPSAAEVPAQPTGKEIQLSHLQIVPAPVGNAVYLTGLMENKGGTEVTGVQVQATFQGTNGENLETQTRPVEALAGPSSNTAEDLTRSPIKPNEQRPFRVYFEHYPAGWNHQVPALVVTIVTGAKS